MYITHIRIKNIRCITQFEMSFARDSFSSLEKPFPAGWHVIIGDNGTGKSSIIRAIAATLIGAYQIEAVFPVWEEWLSTTAQTGQIELEIKEHPDFDKIAVANGTIRPPFTPLAFHFERDSQDNVQLTTNGRRSNIWLVGKNQQRGWFSAGFGPFRRFTGGDEKWQKVFRSAPRVGAHLSVFGEDIALTAALSWLKELDTRRLKEQEENGGKIHSSAIIFDNLKKFINQTGLLPHGVQFKKVDLEGDLVFRDAQNQMVKVTQLSDGFRSILSMTFELIRQLGLSYGDSMVFSHHGDKMLIELPGVVLIDEIDAHLHPAWQARVGQWFTQYFPNLQFIVTTHSPLICRACEKGSIWRLAAPNSEEISAQIIGNERDKLIKGNILDAYGTELFGQNVVRSQSANEVLNGKICLNNCQKH
jgi:predicted ATP-binding protein involved in virulence